MHFGTLQQIHIKKLIKVLFPLYSVKILKSPEISFLSYENKALNFLSQYCDTADYENKLYMWNKDGYEPQTKARRMVPANIIDSVG